MAKCDICGSDAKYDAKLNAQYHGQWAFVCELCFKKYSLCAQLSIEPKIGFATILKE